MRSDAISTELNRIKTIDSYDSIVWEKLYKACTPLIRRLAKKIDARRLNLSTDIIESFFWDKFLFIFNKYQGERDYEHLKASIISGLQMYSFRLMKECYSKQSEFYQSTISFEVLYDDSKEDIDFIDSDDHYQDSLKDSLYRFLNSKLSEDEILLYEIMNDLPPFLQDRVSSSRGKLSVLHIIDYFEFPRSRSSYNYFNTMRIKIKNTLEEAKVELGGLIPDSTMASGFSEEN